MDFLSLIWGSCAGFAPIVTKDYETGALTEEKFYNYPEDLRHLNRFLATVMTEDVYFSPLIFDKPRRLKENAREASVVYADADTCQPEDFRVEPSWKVETSPGRWHCYWVLDDVYSADQVSEVAHKIALAHQHQGCDISGWHKTKLLRVPGTTNTKYGKPFVVTAHSTGAIYSLFELDSAYEDIEIPTVYERANLEIPDSWPALAPLLDRIPVESEAADLYQSPWQVDANGQSNRSERRWALLVRLRDMGFTPQEAAVITYSSKVSKFRDEGRPIEQLFEYEVTKAYADSIVADLSGLSEVPSEPSEADDSVHDKGPGERGANEGAHKELGFGEYEFLTEEERRFLPRSIVDDYVEWVATRTDSPAPYQIANGLMILSAALSDCAFIAPNMGRMDLNLWVMILGDTTTTRKSTSRDLMLTALHALEGSAIGYPVDIGSDPTRESLQRVLVERDGKTSLIHKDEVHGYFKEQKSKMYQAGTVEFFTDVYGGWVPVRIRNDREDKTSGQRASTKFLMHFMGVPSEVASALSIDYFKSGFLARFIYVTATAAPDIDETVRESEAFDDSGNEIDPGLTSFIRKVTSARLAAKRSGGAWRIKMTDEANVRWNKFKVDMGLAVKGQRFEEIVEPARQRLAFSVWKVAALIALGSQEREISLQHILKAISYAEDWFQNLIKLATQISASEWEAFCDDVEKVATSAGKVRYSTVARRFPGKRPRELQDAVASLVAQGRIRSVGDASTGNQYLVRATGDD